MISNDILRSLRYTLKTNNSGLVRIFALADAPVSAEQLVPWLKKEDEEGFVRCPDIVLSNFLNGLIYEFLRYFLRGLTEREHAKS